MSAFRYMLEHPSESILTMFSGGHTTPGVQESEAYAGYKYLSSVYEADGTPDMHHLHVWLEQGSRTTPENVKNSLVFLANGNVRFNKLVIVGRTQQVWRGRAMLWRKRRELVQAAGCVPKIEVLAHPSHDPALRRLVEWGLVALDFLFPNGFTPLYRWLKRRERNGRSA